jgi:transcriptional regulator with XRE-family HTH domain
VDDDLNDKIIPFDFDDEDKENPIGSLLRYNRQEKDLDLDEISRALKVRRDFLEAMEKGRFDLLPAGFYRRSFLKAYAEYLKLDADNLLKMLDEQEKKTKKHEERTPPPPKPHKDEETEEDKTEEQESAEKEVIPAEPYAGGSGVGYWFLIFFGLLVGAACLVFLFNLGIEKEHKIAAIQTVAEVESVVVIPEPLDTMTLFMQLLEEKIGQAPEMILRIEVAGESWIRVYSDGNELFSGFVYDNMNVEFKAKERFAINLGKNQGVRAWLNGFALIPIESGVTYLNRENFQEYIPSDNANEIVRTYE